MPKSRMLYQNDDFGKDYLKGFEGRARRQATTMIVAKASYETTDPTVDSQIVHAAGVRRRTSFSTSPRRNSPPRRSARPTTSAGSRCSSEQRLGLGRVGADAGRAGKAIGMITIALPQGSDRSRLEGRSGHEGMARVHGRSIIPDGDLKDGNNCVYGYRRRADAGAGAEAVRRRPDARERDEAGRQPQELPHRRCCCRGSTINTSPTDYAPIEAMQLIRFDGKEYVSMGKIIGE